jgi:hypothetical protein
MFTIENLETGKVIRNDVDSASLDEEIIKGLKLNYGC